MLHDPKAWNADFETYTRIRYSWTLRADWPRLVKCRPSSAGSKVKRPMSKMAPLVRLEE